jgi:hypothetical protein
LIVCNSNIDRPHVGRYLFHDGTCWDRVKREFILLDYNTPGYLHRYRTSFFLPFEKSENLKWDSSLQLILSYRQWAKIEAAIARDFAPPVYPTAWEVILNDT